jgi:hypothetical protein
MKTNLHVKTLMKTNFHVKTLMKTNFHVKTLMLRIARQGAGGAALLVFA